MIFPFISVSVPNVDYIRKYDLDELLDAEEVCSKLLIIIHNEYCYTKLDLNLISNYAKSVLHTIFQVQMESRGFPLDMELFRELAYSVSAVETKPGHCNFEFPSGWIDKVNSIFHIWICPRCGMKVRGQRHSETECHEYMVASVVEE